MAVNGIEMPFAIREYVGSGQTNAYGNLSIPTNVVTPSTGVVIGVTNDGNYKAVILASSTTNTWILRFFNYATTNMNSLTTTDVTYRIFYILK